MSTSTLYPLLNYIRLPTWFNRHNWHCNLFAPLLELDHKHRISTAATEQCDVTSCLSLFGHPHYTTKKCVSKKITDSLYNWVSIFKQSPHRTQHKWGVKLQCIRSSRTWKHDLWTQLEAPNLLIIIEITANFSYVHIYKCASYKERFSQHLCVKEVSGVTCYLIKLHIQCWQLSQTETQVKTLLNTTAGSV